MELACTFEILAEVHADCVCCDKLDAEDGRYVFFHPQTQCVAVYTGGEWIEIVFMSDGKICREYSTDGNVMPMFEVINPNLGSMWLRKSWNVVPAQALMELFLSEESGTHKRPWGKRATSNHDCTAGP